MIQALSAYFDVHTAFLQVASAPSGSSRSRPGSRWYSPAFITMLQIRLLQAGSVRIKPAQRCRRPGRLAPRSSHHLASYFSP